MPANTRLVEVLDHLTQAKERLAHACNTLEDAQPGRPEAKYEIDEQQAIHDACPILVRMTTLFEYLQEVENEFHEVIDLELAVAPLET